MLSPLLAQLVLLEVTTENISQSNWEAARIAIKII